LHGSSRWLAPLVKALALLLIGLCLPNPVSTRELPKRGANEIIILADNSQSLTVREAADQPLRSETLQAALIDPVSKQEPDWLTDLRRDFRVRIQAVDQQSKTLATAAELKFQGDASRLTSAVLQARQQSAGNPVAAVLLLSDGLSTDPWPSTPIAKGAPVFPVLIGKGPPQLDLSITEIQVTKTAFEDSPVTVSVTLQQSGCAGQSSAVTISDAKGSKLVTEKHRFGPQETRRTLRLQVPLAQTGLSFLRVEAALLPGAKGATAVEPILTNNRQDIAVDRGSGPYRVLFIGGRPAWDYKFLSRSLAADPEIQLPTLMRVAKREPKFEWRGRPGETSNPLFKGFGAEGGDGVQRYDQPVFIRLRVRDEKELADGFPKTPEQLMSDYSAIIIDDLEAEAFSREQLALIEQFVSRRGGSLLMLGGQECFSAGKYEHTSIGKMLPVYLDRPASEPALQQVAFQLTREGWLEPWTRLRKEQVEEESRLSTMQPFFCVNQTFTLKPGASILANVADPEGRSMPALITQRFGSGRVTALTLADVWRWGMKDAEQQNDMQRFWRQLVRHLVVDVPERISFLAQPTEQITHQLQVRVRDTAFEAMDDASVSFSVQQDASPAVALSAEPSLTEPGLFTASYYSNTAGRYTATATVKDAKGALLAERTTGWTLNPAAQETRFLTSDADYLSRIATATGGKLLPLEQLTTFPQLVKQLQLPATERKISPLWHHPAWLSAILLLLITEWALRRRQGWI